MKCNFAQTTKGGQKNESDEQYDRNKLIPKMINRILR